VTWPQPGGFAPLANSRWLAVGTPIPRRGGVASMLLARAGRIRG